MKIGIVGFSHEEINHEMAHSLLLQSFHQLTHRNHHDEPIEIVSGLTNIGIPKIAYQIARELGFITVGISAERALHVKCGIYHVDIQIIEGKTSKDLYQTLRDNKGIKKEVLTDDSGNDRDNAGIAQALDLVGILPNEVINSSDPIVNHNLEGWFAPDTYYYGEGSTDKQVLTDLYKRQQQVLTEAWENRAPNLPYKTPYEALVMASIIEKETSVAEERPLVSAVFRNRLDKGMRMQTDPTIIYGMGSRYEGNIRRKDIDEKTSYNTYQIDGLPPTPIARPSAASIEATLHPADSDALYFVATGNGGHKFTNSLAAHNQAVKEYLGVMREKKSQTPPQ